MSRNSNRKKKQFHRTPDQIKADRLNSIEFEKNLDEYFEQESVKLPSPAKIKPSPKQAELIPSQQPLVSRLLTRSQACEYLSVSRTTLYRMVKNGTLPPCQLLVEGQPRYDRHVIDAWIDAKKAERKIKNG